MQTHEASSRQESKMPRILGCPCLPFSSINEAKVFIVNIVEGEDVLGYSVAINAEKIVRYQSDPELKEVINHARLPSPDGAGAVIGMRILNGCHCIKIDLPKTVLELSNERSWRVFIAGATEDVNRIATERVTKLYPNIKIVGRSNGYCSGNVLFESIGYAMPQIVLLALGSPKQELFASRLFTRFPSIFVVGCGGALDVLAGRAERAPAFMVENNLEWLYRLWKSPSRWRRQLALPWFLWLLLKERAKR